jgi:hypothetical protein
MSLSRALTRLTLAALAFLTTSHALASPPPLPAYGADPKQTSVSGLSSGAFMAVQMQVAYSGSIVGAGVIAGGPYYCAANNVFFAGICMGQTVLSPSPYLMVSAAEEFASAKLIDPLKNLTKRRIYVFSGTDDTVVRQPAVDATVEFFKEIGVKPAQLKYVNNVPAGHAVITPSYGNDCAANADPYISHCSLDNMGYDQAGAILGHIYGALQARVATPAGQIVSFDQSPYASASMADTGYLYVPANCSAKGANCKVHVAIHGCKQSAESVGDQFYTDTGYNNWADNNQLLVLYPQVNKSLSNPEGCWDWWGYTGVNYADKSGPQMKAIKDMVNQLTKPL